jgi:hypothetical protein
LKTRWILLVVFILTLLLAACAVRTPAVPAATPADAGATPTRAPAEEPDVDYTLVGMDFGRGSKCILEVELQATISEEQITQIAYYLSENEAKDCAPLYIFYYLPGQEQVYEKAWAYSHFDPELKVKISEP